MEHHGPRRPSLRESAAGPGATPRDADARLATFVSRRLAVACIERAERLAISAKNSFRTAYVPFNKTGALSMDPQDSDTNNGAGEQQVWDNYEPEDVERLDRALAATCARIGETMAVSDGIRDLVAIAVLEGARQGIRAHDDLVLFALRAIPKFR